MACFMSQPGTRSVHATGAWPKQINVGGTRNVLELMQELAIPKGVYTSTLAVFSDTHGRIVDESYRHYGPWLSEYDRTKWMAHYQVAEPMIQAGLPLTIVQPGLGVWSGRHRRDPYNPGRLPQAYTAADATRHGLLLGHVDDTAHRPYPGHGPGHSWRKLYHCRAGTYADRRARLGPEDQRRSRTTPAPGSAHDANPRSS